MGIQPRIRIFQPSRLIRGELPAIAKQARLSDDTRQPSVILTVGANYETDKHASSRNRRRDFHRKTSLGYHPV